MNQKCYIKPGDTCSICLCGIYNKKNSYLTDCVHCFHRSCISEYYHHKLLANKVSCLECPNCRCRLGNPSFYSIYNMFHKDSNYLDLVENVQHFENKLFGDMLDICHNNTNESHYLGMNNKCSTCVNYQKYGDK